jgi:hypothetical protein
MDDSPQENRLDYRSEPPLTAEERAVPLIYRLLFGAALPIVLFLFGYVAEAERLDGIGDSAGFQGMGLFIALPFLFVALVIVNTILALAKWPSGWIYLAVGLAGPTAAVLWEMSEVTPFLKGH